MVDDVRPFAAERRGLRLRESCAVIAVLLTLCVSTSAWGAITVSPGAVDLDSPEASQQLLVSAPEPGGRVLDVTRQVAYEVADPAIARIGNDGLVRPLAEGQTEIVIRQGELVLRVPVTVRGLQQPTPVSFQHEVIPILTKARCNSGGCHGKAEGQNGFKLSIFGYDAAADHVSLILESRTRRVSAADPERSLLLRKGSAEVPHGGGRKIEPGSYRYQRLRRWIAEGSPFAVPGESPITGIEVEPAQQVLLAEGSQQLRVTAIDAEGRRQCVTVEAEYESNASTIADVDHRGLVQATSTPGEAAILVRYLGHVAVCRVTLPRPGVQFERPVEKNFIDGLVWSKLERLGIAPSAPADDAMFLRRVYLDTIGTLPTAAEARQFLTSTDPDRRAKLIDALLERPEYADYWALKWADILSADQLKITPQGTYALTRWLRRQFAENRPYDEFVREILTVQGSVLRESPAGFYKALGKPDIVSRSFSQLFLGVRIECAECHHHPSEKWGQDDYYGLAGFFTGVTTKKLPNGAEAVVSRGGVDLKNPRTDTVIPARALGAAPADFSDTTDRRVALARWLTAPDNPFFARTISNRLWAHYFGRGLVDPVDDIRDTNPPTNEPLMQALIQHMRDVRYDLKAFTRTLLNSQVYQLSSEPNDSNRDDEQNFSHAYYKALPAEVLLDAVSQATGIPEKFNGWPEGYRAIQVWDNRMPSYFFRIFGRPVRATVCECERSNEPSIAQALHLLNSPEIMAKVQARQGVARKLTESAMSDRELVDELYLGTLARFPTDVERELMLGAFAELAGDRKAAVEDVLWTLLNTKEFLYNH